MDGNLWPPWLCRSGNSHAIPGQRGRGNREAKQEVLKTAARGLPSPLTPVGELVNYKRQKRVLVNFIFNYKPRQGASLPWHGTSSSVITPVTVKRGSEAFLQILWFGDRQ